MSSRTVTTQRKRVYVRGSAPERFAAHVIPCPRVSGMTPCLEWQGSRDKKGYGRFNAGTGGAPRFMLAHRFAFELAGRLDDRPLLHACDNPRCCNVDHLSSGSIAENNEDMRRKGRYAYGVRSGHAKLNDAAVRSIRDRSARESWRALAEEYGVAYRTLVDVVHGVTWQHVAPLVAVDVNGVRVQS